MPGTRGVGSAAAAPQRRDLRRPPPRCCFGTRSRSITTSTRPAATCGESRAAAALARGGCSVGCPRPAAARRFPGGIPGLAPLPLSERPFSFFPLFFLLYLFIFFFFSGWLGSSLQRCFIACARSPRARAGVAQLQGRRCGSGAALSEVCGKRLLANGEGTQFSGDGIFFLCFLGRCVKSAEFHFLNLSKPAFSCLRTVAFN